MGRLTYRDPDKTKKIKEYYGRDELAFSDAPTYEILNRLAFYEDKIDETIKKQVQKAHEEGKI